MQRQQRDRVGLNNNGNERNSFVHSSVINGGLIGPRTEFMTSALRASVINSVLGPINPPFITSE